MAKGTGALGWDHWDWGHWDLGHWDLGHWDWGHWDGIMGWDHCDHNTRQNSNLQSPPKKQRKPPQTSSSNDAHYSVTHLLGVYFSLCMENILFHQTLAAFSPGAALGGEILSPGVQAVEETRHTWMGAALPGARNITGRH